MKSKIASALYANAEANPDKQAIWCDDKSLTYKELADLVSRYSNLLLNNGVIYGDHIAALMDNSIESVALIFSAADIGVCIIPLNPALPVEANLTAIIACEAKHVIATSEFLKKYKEDTRQKKQGIQICTDKEFPETVAFSNIDKMPVSRPKNINILSDDDSYILAMTSGSFINPNPVILSQKNKYDRAIAHINAYRVTSEDRILVSTTLCHSLAERLVIMPIITGATSIVLSNFTPSKWIKCAEEQEPSFTITVPDQLASIMKLLSQIDTNCFRSFRSIVSSSSRLEDSLKNEIIRNINCEFHEIYGTSEVSTVSSICFQTEPTKQKSVGKAFDEVDIRILRGDNDTDYDSDCAPYEIGEIACKTRLQCKGYYKQNSMMKLTMVGEYFRTGDLGYLDEDGYLYFSDRKKDLIITGAMNVYPHDIDHIVSRMPEVEECAAFSYPDELLGEVVGLAVVLKEDCEISIQTIKTFCAKQLADFQQPQKIFIVDRLPKNTMGKLQRRNIYNYIKMQE